MKTFQKKLDEKIHSTFWNLFRSSSAISSTKKSFVTYGVYHCYQTTQAGLNKAAKLFYDKKSTNPHQKPYVNKDYPVAANDVDKYSFKCKKNINYPDLKYYHQPRVFDCADTSIKMIIDYHNQKCDQIGYSEFKELRTQFESNFENRKISLFSGTPHERTKGYSLSLIESDHRKVKDAFTIDQFAYYLYKHGPIIASTNDLGGHFLVVKGVVDNEVIIHDPWSGPNLTYSFEDFKKMWDGTILYCVVGYSKDLENTLLEKNNASILSSGNS